MARRARGGERAGAPAWVKPMLAKPDGGQLREGPEWAYEYKLDGYRACMQIAPGGTTVLTSRNGIDFTAEFSDLTGVLTDALEGQAAVLDGEIVVYNEAGQIDFGALQERRGRYQTHSTGRPGEPFEDVPVRFLAFDLLQLGTEQFQRESYDERRRLLTRLPMPDPYRISVVRGFSFTDLAADRRTPRHLLEHVVSSGHEGLVAKHRLSAYNPGRRSDAWLKHPLTQTAEVIVCGYRPGQGRIAGRMGGLLLGAHDPDTGDLLYIGDVGTGFTEAERGRLQVRLDTLERIRHPFAMAPPRADTARAHWVKPELVGEVVFRQFTRGAGRLRHTAWRGLREDKKPADVLAPQRREPGSAETRTETSSRSTTRTGDHAPGAPETDDQSAVSPVGGTKIAVQAGGRQLTLSNLDKALFPDGFTKGEVINYYSRIAPVLLPHLTGRPVTFIRFPDGVDGEQFFEKNVPQSAPGWLPTVRIARSGARGSGEAITYALLNELAAVVWAANMAALELHVPQWTVDEDGARRPPDRLVFDLDPGPGTSIVQCCRVAERLHDFLTDDGLTPLPKTSGSKGMQLYCAITTDDPAAPSAYAKKLARRLARETPDQVTAVMAKAHRTGRVFVDWSQNNPAKTTVAPYSLRGREHPTASTPITWDEVRACRRATQLVFTADDVLDRVDEHGDLLADLDATRAVLP